MNLQRAAEGAYADIKMLYTSAFPKNERAPFFLLKRRALQNRATMLVAEENGEFVGFAYTVGCNHSVYLFYFAVAENKRGSGKGSEILRLLKAYYHDRVIFLAREPLDETAENSRERINRRNFYLRNGLIDMPFQIQEADVIYDLMSTSADFTPSDYDALMQNWAGKILTRFVKMSLLRKTTQHSSESIAD